MNKKINLTSKILICLFLGAVLGLILKTMPDGFIKDTLFLNGILKILGDGFIRAIKMLVVPLVLVSLACGATSMGDVKKLGRIGGKTLLFYICTTALAISISIVIALLINPGIGLDMSSIVTSDPTISDSKSFADIILNMIPSNPFESMVNAEMLQIIVFALLLGTAINLVGKKAEPVKKLLESFNEICMKMIELIMNLAPFGVFGLMATTFANTGFDAMIPLLKYMAAILISLAIQGFVIYSGLLKAFTGLDLKPFYKKFTKVAAVTFSTSSSSASLPVSKEAMEELGVDSSISSFTLPLGATINMDGTSIMQGTAAIFISQVYGIDLGLPGILTIILTATLASIGTAGVPGVGMITLSMVLNSVGLPIEGIGLILGIDRILDMCRTTINVMGDCACTLIISKKEKELNEEKYYTQEIDVKKEIGAEVAL